MWPVLAMDPVIKRTPKKKSGVTEKGVRQPRFVDLVKLNDGPRTYSWFGGRRPRWGWLRPSRPRLQLVFQLVSDFARS